METVYIVKDRDNNIQFIGLDLKSTAIWCNGRQQEDHYIEQWLTGSPDFEINLCRRITEPGHFAY